jgi:hypothetical protein
MGYTYDMNVYLGRDGPIATYMMTAIHAAVRSLTRRIKKVGHRLFTNNFFSSRLI